MAEDARIITVKRIDEEQLQAERRAGAAREFNAENGRAAAQTETDRVTRAAAAERLVAQADLDRVRRDNDAQAAAALIEADRLKRDNDARMAAAQVDADRLKREHDSQIVIAQTEADRLRLDNDSKLAAAQTEADRLKRERDAQDAQIVVAQTEADRLKQDNDSKLAAALTEAGRLKQENDAQTATAQTEADRLRRENDAQRAAAQAELDNVGGQKRQLEADEAGLRAQLLLQFNAILQTRDTARGLIVNMSDVLFDTAKFSLRPEAREKLAKVAGIVEGHPGLRLAVEGHTDSVGGDDYNQQLSEQRGGSVRDYLVAQGMAGSSVTSEGFGKTRPVASNDSASGRQQNRRVELVISGEIIGTVIGVPLAAR